MKESLISGLLLCGLIALVLFMAHSVEPERGKEKRQQIRYRVARLQSCRLEYLTKQGTWRANEAQAAEHDTIPVTYGREFVVVLKPTTD